MFRKMIVILTVSVVFLLTTASGTGYRGYACTNFAAVSGDTVLFGNNEDASGDHPLGKDPDKTVIWFIPPTEGQYGMVQLGWYYDGDKEFYQGGMNEYGLCYDSTAIPEMKLNDDPGKTYNPSNSNLWEDIIGLNRNVDEAVEYAKDYNFGSMWFQLFLTDASGKAVVISPGKDGELAFDYLDPGVGFMVQTNFNRSYPVSHLGTYPDPRYDTAFNALSAAMASGNVNVREFESILDSTSQKGHDAYTPYSNIFNPVNKRIYVYYATQFNDAVSFNLIDELGKGKHEYLLSQLVSDEAHQNGLEYHKEYLGRNLRFTVLAIFGIIALFILISMLSLYLGKRKRRKTGIR